VRLARSLRGYGGDDGDESEEGDDKTGPLVSGRLAGVKRERKEAAKKKLNLAKKILKGYSSDCVQFHNSKRVNPFCRMANE